MARDSHEISMEIDDDDDDDVFAQSYHQMVRQRRASKYQSSPGRRKSQFRRRSSLAPGIDPEQARRKSRSAGRRRRSRSASSALSSGRSDMESDESEDEVEDVAENLKLQQDIIAGLKAQPWPMKKKLKTLRMAKVFVDKFEGQLSKSKGYLQNVLRAFSKFKREITNIATLLTPWEQRIKSIESHFGSVVSSYFVFLRWVFLVNLVNSAVFLAFIILPEVIFSDKTQSRKNVPAAEEATSLNLATIWAFEGYIKYSVMLYGYYSSQNLIILNSRYRLPFAYLIVTLASYGYCLIVILRRMAANSRLSKMSMGDEQYTFCWKYFTSWDFVISNSEAAKNKYAATATVFKEAILEEEEKAKEDENSKHVTLGLRILANFLVMIVLSASCYAVYLVVKRSSDLDAKKRRDPSYAATWWEANEVAVVLSVMTQIYPSIFELIGMMERYHPRINLRWQLVRILVLYLMNLYTLVIALNGKISDMSDQIKEQLDIYHERERAYFGNMTLNCTYDYPDNISDTSLSLTTLSPPNCTNISSVARPEGVTAELCWETMVGQEMYKLTVMDLVMTAAGILIIDFFRGMFVRYANICWCWDLELKFPEYGEFKIAENILHLIYNQGMIWMGLFFAPALPTLNIFKLLVMLYIRAWAVMMCNIPHERIFKASKSNNFYFALLLMMLFLCALPAGYCLVGIKPSPNCGPFAGQDFMYHVLMQFVHAELPAVVGSVLNIIASPTIIIPVFILLIMGIYYLFSMTQSLKESNSELKDQLEYERTEEKKKIYAMADAKAGGGGGGDTGTGGKTKDNEAKTNISKNVGKATVTVSKYGDKQIADVPTIKGKDGKNNMVKIISGNKEKLVSLDHLQQLVQHQNTMSPKRTPVAVVTGKQTQAPTKRKRKPKGDKEGNTESRDTSNSDHVINICLNEDQHLGEGVSDQGQGHRGQGDRERQKRGKGKKKRDKQGVRGKRSKERETGKEDGGSESDLSDTGGDERRLVAKHATQTYDMPQNLHKAVLTKSKHQQAPPEIIITRGTSEASSEAEGRKEEREARRKSEVKSRWQKMSEAVHKHRAMLKARGKNKAGAGPSAAKAKKSSKQDKVSSQGKESEIKKKQSHDTDSNKQWLERPVVHEEVENPLRRRHKDRDHKTVISLPQSHSGIDVPIVDKGQVNTDTTVDQITTHPSQEAQQVQTQQNDIIESSILATPDYSDDSDVPVSREATKEDTKQPMPDHSKRLSVDTNKQQDIQSTGLAQRVNHIDEGIRSPISSPQNNIDEVIQMPTSTLLTQDNGINTDDNQRNITADTRRQQGDQRAKVVTQEPHSYKQNREEIRPEVAPPISPKKTHYKNDVQRSNDNSQGRSRHKGQSLREEPQSTLHDSDNILTPIAISQTTSKGLHNDKSQHPSTNSNIQRFEEEARGPRNNDITVERPREDTKRSHRDNQRSMAGPQSRRNVVENHERYSKYGDVHDPRENDDEMVNMAGTQHSLINPTIIQYEEEHQRYRNNDENIPRQREEVQTPLRHQGNQRSMAQAPRYMKEHQNRLYKYDNHKRRDYNNERRFERRIHDMDKTLSPSYRPEEKRPREHDDHFHGELGRSKQYTQHREGYDDDDNERPRQHDENTQRYSEDHYEGPTRHGQGKMSYRHNEDESRKPENYREDQYDQSRQFNPGLSYRDNEEDFKRPYHYESIIIHNQGSSKNTHDVQRISKPYEHSPNRYGKILNDDRHKIHNPGSPRYTHDEQGTSRQYEQSLHRHGEDHSDGRRQHDRDIEQYEDQGPDHSRHDLQDRHRTHYDRYHHDSIQRHRHDEDRPRQPTGDSNRYTSIRNEYVSSIPDNLTHPDTPRQTNQTMRYRQDDQGSQKYDPQVKPTKYDQETHRYTNRDEYTGNTESNKKTKHQDKYRPSYDAEEMNRDDGKKRGRDDIIRRPDRSESDTHIRTPTASPHRTFRPLTPDLPPYEAMTETLEDQSDHLDFDVITRDVRDTKNSFSDMMKSRPRRQQSHRSNTRPEVIHKDLLMKSGGLSVAADFNDKKHISDSEDDLDRDGRQGGNDRDDAFNIVDDQEPGPSRKQDNDYLPENTKTLSNHKVDVIGLFGASSQKLSHFADVVDILVRHKRGDENPNQFHLDESGHDFGESFSDDLDDIDEEELGDTVTQRDTSSTGGVGEVEKDKRNQDGSDCGTGKFCRKGRHVHYTSDEEDYSKENKPMPQTRKIRHPGSSEDYGKGQATSRRTKSKLEHSSSDEVFQPQSSMNKKREQYSQRHKTDMTDSTETEGPIRPKPKRYLSVEDAYYSEQIKMDNESPVKKSKVKRKSSRSDVDSDVHSSREHTVDDDSDDEFMQMMKERKRQRKKDSKKKKRK